MKKKNLSLTIISLIFVNILIIAPFTLAKPRKTYIIDFLHECQIEDENGFANSIEEDRIISYESTAYALEMLNYYEFPELNTTKIETNLKEILVEMLNEDTVNVYDLYFLLKSLNILNYSLDANLNNRVYKYLNATENSSGGFAYSNTSSSVSIASTYFVIQSYKLINKTVKNIILHKNWTIACNNTDGGYGGAIGLTSTIYSTFLATSILIELGNNTDLVNASQTLSYLLSFYVESEINPTNIGGYLPEHNAKNALLSSTYYCVKAISLIDSSTLNNESTVNWVLQNQNLQDGGFIDSTVDMTKLYSSLISTYYAFKTLNYFDENLIVLDEDVGMVEFNWIIFLIVLTIIGVAVAIFIYIKRKRKV